ncbi:MAG TPA: hypothetical protein VF228_17395 [Iamia sp.]
MRFVVAGTRYRSSTYATPEPGAGERIAQRDAASRKLDLMRRDEIARHACDWRACEVADCPNNRPAPKEDQQ